MPKEIETLNLNSLKTEFLEKKPTLNLETLKAQSNIENKETESLRPKKLIIDNAHTLRKTKRRKEPRNYISFFRNRSFLIIISFAILIFFGLIVLKFWYTKTENFHFGNWGVELSEKDKLDGIKEFVYGFKETELTQSIELESQGVKVKAGFHSDLKLNEINRNKITFTKSNYEIKSLDIQVPTQICSDNKNCDEIKKTFEANFREEFKKTNSNKGDIVLKKVSSNRISLESSQEGDIILIKR